MWHWDHGVLSNGPNLIFKWGSTSFPFSLSNIFKIFYRSLSRYWLENNWRRVSNLFILCYWDFVLSATLFTAIIASIWVQSFFIAFLYCIFEISFKYEAKHLIYEAVKSSMTPKTLLNNIYYWNSLYDPKSDFKKSMVNIFLRIWPSILVESN